MKTVRAKFSCWSVSADEYGEHVVLEAVSGTNEQDNKENNQFAESTPSGRLTMMISNPSAKGFFKPGEEYYLDFSEASS